MRRYELTLLAENDLLEISDYTAGKWGEEQAERYLRRLEDCFTKIASGKIPVKQPLAAYSKLKSVRCEHYYVFFLAGKRPVILAIFHEKMDCIIRLKNRLAD